MPKEDYTNCMVPWMSGKGKSAEQRKMDMCVGAKLCSGKSTTQAAAEEICINQPPKEPKASKKRGGIDPVKLAACVSGSVELKGLTKENFGTRLETAINHCAKGEKRNKVGRF